MTRVCPSICLSTGGGGVSPAGRGGGSVQPGGGRHPVQPGGWVQPTGGGSVQLAGGGSVQRGGSAKIGQQNEYSLHGGRYASCVHAGGLSCVLNVFLMIFIQVLIFLAFMGENGSQSGNECV